MSLTPEYLGGPPLWGPGTRLANQYRIESVVGQGGFGVVYRAHDEELDRTVAIKALLPGGSRPQSPEVSLGHLATGMGAGAGSRGRPSVLDEARLGARLSHPHILIVHDVAEEEGVPFLVAEYLEGGSLETRITRQGPMGEEELLALTRALGGALSHAHDRGLLHRDLKPGNVLYTTDGIPKLVDFGLARPSGGTGYSIAGVGAGTMYYSAPEQLESAQDATTASDLFSLGATLYFAATGKRPTGRLRLDLVPGSVRGALEQALEEHPAERPASVRSFLDLVRFPGLPARPPAPAAEEDIPMAALAPAPEDAADLPVARLIAALPDAPEDEVPVAELVAAEPTRRRSREPRPARLPHPYEHLLGDPGESAGKRALVEDSQRRFGVLMQGPAGALSALGYRVSAVVRANLQVQPGTGTPIPEGRGLLHLLLGVQRQNMASKGSQPRPPLFKVRLVFATDARRLARKWYEALPRLLAVAGQDWHLSVPPEPFASTGETRYRFEYQTALLPLLAGEDADRQQALTTQCQGLHDALVERLRESRLV